MQETSETDNKPNDTDNSNKRAARTGFWWIVASGIVMFVILLGVSIFHPTLTERTKFAIVNALSIFVLVAIAIQAVIYRKQWDVMRKQQEVLESQANTLGSQVAAMQEQLATMREQSGIMRDSLKETRSMVSQNERAVETAEKSIQIAQQNMICAQRAYVTIPGGEVEYEIGGDVFFRLKIKNSGNTPANNVEIVHAIEFREQSPPTDINQSQWSQVGLIAPRSHKHFYTEKISEYAVRLPPVEGGKRYLYCWGVIRYLDLFGQTRYTKFCFVKKTGHEKVAFGVCDDGGNEAK